MLILQKNDPRLRVTSLEVKPDEIKLKKIKKIIADMKSALASQEDGVAIAAPQLGVPLRIFVVSGKVFAMLKDAADSKQKEPDRVFINPKITRISKKKGTVEEGCLSVRNIYGKIKRADKVRIQAYGEDGNFFERGGSGLLSQIFQHETDHLNGILFTDTATDLAHYDPNNHKVKNK